MDYRPIVLDRVGSTNDIALEAAVAGARPGLVVQAHEQVQGKGRKERDWGSPRGGLWMSVVLDAEVPDPMTGLIPLAVGIACCRGLRDLDIPVELRWPNDLMVDDAKLGGILVESTTRPEGLGPVVAGIGINVSNTLPVPEATSVQAQGGPGEVPRVREAILNRLPVQETRLADGEAQSLCNAFMRYAWGIGDEMRLDGTPCRPKEIATDGALIVETVEGEIQVHRSGSLRRPNSQDEA